MNRSMTAVSAALDAVLAVAIGIAVLLAPLTALWAFQYGLAVDWAVFYRAAADFWLLGHGVDVRFVLDPALASGLGLAGADQPFVVTIGVLGFAVLSALLAARTGGRLDAHAALGAGVAIGTFALLSAAVTLTAGAEAAQPSRWQGVLLPTLVYAAGLGVGRVLLTRPAPGESGVPPLLARVPAEWRALGASALRIGAASVAGLLAAASLAVAVLLVFSYARVIALYESLQAGGLGGAILTLGQLAVVPDLVVWTAAWLTGPGFALGTGSSVSPLGTVVGPIPALPVFGALPSGALEWGFLGLIVPVVLAFLAGAIARPRLDRDLYVPASIGEALGAAAGAGVVGGVLLGILAAASSGSAGPGRLADVGAEPLLVGAITALEIALGAAAGLLSSRRRDVVEPHETGPIDLSLRR
ncbi:MAG TPA: DUF6350 family protein [Naasia sp.]|jgi:hypothetical protein